MAVMAAACLKGMCRAGKAKRAHAGLLRIARPLAWRMARQSVNALVMRLCPPSGFLNQPDPDVL
jgi:hypothetical protein